MKPISPTPYPDVNEILNSLLFNVQEMLGKQFVGMYLFGSLANGDFDDHSDIDVLIVTDGEISGGVTRTPSRSIKMFIAEPSEM